MPALNEAFTMTAKFLFTNIVNINVTYNYADVIPL